MRAMVATCPFSTIVGLISTQPSWLKAEDGWKKTNVMKSNRFDLAIFVILSPAESRSSPVKGLDVSFRELLRHKETTKSLALFFLYGERKIPFCYMRVFR